MGSLLLNETGFPPPCSSPQMRSGGLLITGLGRPTFCPIIWLSLLKRGWQSSWLWDISENVSQAHLSCQHREKRLPRMKVKNSWFALKGVFTLKHGKQVLAATSNMTGIFSSWLSLKIPIALLCLLLPKFLPFWIVGDFYYIMRSLGEEGVDTPF